MKAYFPSFREAIAVEKSGADVILGALRGLDDGLEPSLDLDTE